MPDKMGKNQKNVIVAVYVERPRKRRLLTSNGGVSTHHHHHHHHFHLHRSHKHGGVGGSSNRRSELLDYSRRLRASAAKTPHNHHQNNPISVSSSVQQPINQIMAAQTKRKHAKAPACMGNWKCFLKSLTMSSGGKKKKKKKNNSSSTNFTATKAKVIMQSFQVHKNKGFFKKILTAIQKYR